MLDIVCMNVRRREFKAMRALAAPAIFLVTLWMVLAKPVLPVRATRWVPGIGGRPVPIDTGIAATIGAGLAILAGVVTLADVGTVAGIVWDATFALIAIVVISVVLDQAGFFRWAALLVARRAAGNGRAIFLAVTLLGAAVSTLFTNDATVLIFTPIVYEMLAALGFDHRQMLPYLMACGFVADTMSIPLAVSNLTNMIAVRFFDLSFARYAVLMLIPSLVCLAATLAVLFWYYRREIPASYNASQVDNPESAVRDPFLFGVGVMVLGAMVVAFFLGSFFDLPVSFVIAAGALLLLLATRKNRIVEPAAVLKQAPWHVVVFAMGMFLVVYGMADAGLRDLKGGWLVWLSEQGAGPAIMGTGILAAAFSSVMNNLPAVMIGSLSISFTGVEGSLRDGMVLANIIGSDIGPKMTPIGSLATLIWLHYLHRKGVEVDWRYYLKVGLTITPPVLLATLAALWAGMLLVY